MRGDVAWSSGRRQALEHDFEVLVTAGGPVDLVRDYLSSFPEQPGTARTRYVVQRAGDESYDVTVDGSPVADGVVPWRAVALLGWHINQSVVDHSTSRYVLLHAAAAVREGCAVILPAPMEHGKTTTVTGLLRAGFSYLTDEAVALDPVTLRIQAYPKPLTIDRGSWSLFPELRPPSVQHDAASWWVNAETVRPGAVVGSAEPRLVVLPAYRAGTATDLSTVGHSAAVMELAASTFRFTSAPARNLESLAQLVRRCPTYRLAIGDLDEAVAMIDELIDDLVRAA